MPGLLHRLILLVALAASLCCAPSLAQTPPVPPPAPGLATLVADRVEVTGNDLLIADGAVEVNFQGRRLRATRITFDGATDRLTIEGPITLTDGPDTLVLASQADLAADLSDGVLQSARLVLNQQLQIAAAEMVRTGGRYTQLSQTVASSCQVCTLNPTPLWEIRARRVVHDQLERQLYFDHAQFRVAGLPVFYLPRLRMPDPSLKRTRGFLMPDVRTTSGLGSGFKIPYFLPLGDSRDLTFTPYLTTKNGRALDLRYRQAFGAGLLELSGALARDDLMPGDSRGYVKALGDFALPSDFDLTFRIEAVSDPAYLLDYGLSEKDRLDSRIEVSRTRRNEHISARLIHFNSLRSDEDNATLPSLITDFNFYRRFSLGAVGGEGGLRFQTHSQSRSSDSLLDGDGDGIPDGRDTSRASLLIDWRRTWVAPAGILATALGEVSADAYDIRQDGRYEGSTLRSHAAAGVELRWPWVKAGRLGASHVIEPVVQLIWSPDSTDSLPNEDSTLVEFDEGNLFALNRFPGSDAVETGARANIGVTWTRHDPTGWTLGATLGRVLRESDTRQFGVASGLGGAQSDWLVGVEVSLLDGLRLTNRVLFDDSFDVTKGEMRMDLQRERYGIASSYVWMVADTTENRPADTSELFLDSSYKLTDAWTANMTGRYDFIAERATSAGLGLAFRNECLQVDLSLSRRFTSSTNVDPTTDFGLSVDLLGFGGGGEAGPARICRR
ncbi:LPS assembly protein LptD [Paracoccaceae bacterium Fryx2]|nr:LPS assembly protein LptD [Paracoccaceae bacterium Fryx2]